MRQVGISVAVTSMLGDGFPDLVAGYNRITFLFEVKDPSKPPSKRKLTPDEQDFFDSWKGHASVVESLEDVLKVINESVPVHKRIIA